METKKPNVKAKLLTTEYAIVNEEGEVQVTTNLEIAISKMPQNQVYKINTYKLRPNKQLKN